jgi:hypothetical protein
MSWRGRLSDLILAGGAFAATSGCSSTPLVRGKDVGQNTATVNGRGAGQDTATVNGRDAAQDTLGVSGKDARPVTDAAADTRRDAAIDYNGRGFGPCSGNAPPDPCMCGRPDMGSYFVEQCEEERECQAQGGRWSVTYVNIPGYCSGGAVDGSPTVSIDASGDGALDR